MFCKNCGAEISDKAAICVKCGVPVAPVAASSGNSSEWVTALLLCIFLGSFGAHRFYTKSNEIAIAQLLLGLFTCFIFSWIWALIDLILLLTGNYRTGDGRVLKQG